MSKHMVTITDQNFESEVLKSEIPVLVDFSASWCAPCRAIAPILEELAAAQKGRVKVGKLDVDENQRTAQKYQVFSIPTLLLFKDGKVIGQSVGLIPKGKIEDLIAKAFAK